MARHTIPSVRNQDLANISKRKRSKFAHILARVEPLESEIKAEDWSVLELLIPASPKR